MSEGYIANRLAEQPMLFVSLTGLWADEFQRLVAEIRDKEPTYRRDRLNHHRRWRAPGGGRKQTCPLPEQILMLLLYHRLPVIQSLLARLFNVQQTTVSRNIKATKPLFGQFAPLPERERFPPGTKFKTIDELFTHYAELKEIIGNISVESVYHDKNP